MTNPVDRSPLLAFVQAFLDGPLRDRWTFICQSSLNRWVSLDPYTLWTKSERGARCSHDFPGKHIAEMFEIYDLEESRDRIVSVVCFGHAKPQVYEATLAEATTGDKVPFEGLVLVQPTELVFCHTHEGEVRVFESEAHRRFTKRGRRTV